MKCTDFERILNEQFGAAGLQEHGALAVHADECPACRESWERFRLLHDAVKLWRRQVPEVDLAAALTSALDEAPIGAGDCVLSVRPESHSAVRATCLGPELAGIAPCGRRPKTLRRAWALAVAGCAVLVAAALLGPMWLGNPRGGPIASQEQPDDKAVSSRPPVPGAAREPAGERSTPARDPLAAPYRDLAERAAGALGEATALIMPASHPGMHRTRTEAGATSEWIDGLQHQLKPIGRSLEDAFDFLWQAGESADRPRT